MSINGPLIESRSCSVSVASVDFPGGNAQISDVSKCVGDATLVTVRNKRRVGYTYELTLKFTGEWSKGEEKTMLKGQIDIPEFSFGELDDFEVFKQSFSKLYRERK